MPPSQKHYYSAVPETSRLDPHVVAFLQWNVWVVLLGLLVALQLD